jgi:PEP-CTERM motif-containing protein
MRCRRILPIAIVIALSHVPDVRATTLTFDSVVNGSNVDVSIKIFDVTDLFTFGFDVTYDDTLFDVLNVVEGSFLPSVDPNPPNGTFFFTVPNDIATFGPTFRIEDSLLNPIQTGASTSPGVPGILAVITFGLVPGVNLDILLSGVTLLDSQGNEISLTTVSEPATIGLLGLGLLGVARRFRRQG